MPYAALAELADRELDLVAAGAWEDLAALGARRAALVAGLPEVPPPDARPLIERLVGQQRYVSAALARAGAEAGAELGRLGRGQAAVKGYAATAAPPAASGRLDGSG